MTLYQDTQRISANISENLSLNHICCLGLGSKLCIQTRLYAWYEIGIEMQALEYHASHCIYSLTLFKEGLSLLLIGH